MRKTSQFLLWPTALELELLVLEFVRSVREGNFPLHVLILGNLVPWMFALDLVNYSRWLSIHIRDLVNLKEKQPSVYAEFEQGKFVVQKSQHLFLTISLDHNHEQENEMIKGEGGTAGLTESPAALRCWMVAGPEIARAVREFESTYEARKPNDNRHYEQVPSVQKAFAQDVKNLVNVIEEIGTHSVKTAMILLYWTLRKLCLNVSSKRFQVPRRRESQCMTNM